MPWFIKCNIGEGASTEYLSIGEGYRKGQFYWSAYPYEAIQFCRKQDAERMLSAILYEILNYDQYYREDNIYIDDILET
jgi:hypothetical protein